MQALECQSAYCSGAQASAHIPLLKCSSQCVAHRSIAPKRWRRLYRVPPHIFAHSVVCVQILLHIISTQRCINVRSVYYAYIYDMCMHLCTDAFWLVLCSSFRLHKREMETGFAHEGVAGLFLATVSLEWTPPFDLNLNFIRLLLTTKSMEGKNSTQDYCDQGLDSQCKTNKQKLMTNMSPYCSHSESRRSNLSGNITLTPCF